MVLGRKLWSSIPENIENILKDGSKYHYMKFLLNCYKELIFYGLNHSWQNELFLIPLKLVPLNLPVLKLLLFDLNLLKLNA